MTLNSLKEEIAKKGKMREERFMIQGSIDTLEWILREGEVINGS